MRASWFTSVTSQSWRVKPNITGNPVVPEVAQKRATCSTGTVSSGNG
jgi:hypothetical protein